MLSRVVFAVPLVALVLVGIVAPRALALTDADVRRKQQSCEAAREKALAPIRERRTQACIDQQLRSPDRCKHYYSTYGNVSPGPSGAPQPGLFYDLPECQEWLDAREKLRQSRSRD
jgi:hypothetical protein